MKNLSDIIASSVLIIFGIGAIIGAIGLRIGTPTEPQPGFFPFLSGSFIIILSIIIFIKGFTGKSQSRISLGEIKRPAVLIAILFLFSVFLESLGYAVTSPIIIISILLIMGIKSLRVILITSLLLSIGTYLLFDLLLGIKLPAGIFSYLSSLR